MKPTCTISKDDFRRACIMMKNIALLAPKGSAAAKAIINNCQAIINLYKKQTQGVQMGKGTNTILGMHLQYAQLYRETMRQKNRG